MANVHSYHSNHKLVLLLPPADQGDLNTAWVEPFADGGSAERAVFEIVVGTAGANLDMKLTQATSSGGAGAKDITGAAITAITTTTDLCIKTIEIGPGAMDDKNGFKWVRAEVLVAGASTAVYSVTLIKHRLRYPGTGTQDATYSEQVVVLG